VRGCSHKGHIQRDPSSSTIPSRSSATFSCRIRSCDGLSTAMGCKYEYRVLKAREIRLLEFFPSEPLPSLIHVSIDDNPEYDAISYCWGKENCLHTFQLQTGTTLISSNLFEILNSLAGTHFLTTRLWIDALCIDQENDLEKSCQIGLMKEIYSKAGKVLALLQSLSDDSKMAIVMIPFMLKNKDKIVNQLLRNNNSVKECCDPEMLQIFWSGIRGILQHPWFARIWTLQEAVLARRLQIVLNGVWIGFEALQTLMEMLIETRLIQFIARGPLPEDHTTDGLLAIQHLRYNSQRGICPFMLILTSRKRKASIATDSVYGILGLFDEAIRKDITISMQLQIRDLFVQTTKAILKHTNKLDILKLVESQPTVQDLPSWCPSFSSVGSTEPFCVGRHSAGCGRSSASFKFLISAEGRDALQITGICIDRVVAFVVPYPKDSISLDQLMMWERVCFSYSEKAYPNPTTLLKAHLATICADFRMPGNLSSTANLNSYSAMRSRLFGKSSKEERYEFATDHLDFMCGLLSATSGRSFFLTEQKRIGIGPSSTNLGSLICVFHGAETPFLLQETKDSNAFRLLGESYVYGVMNGEALLDPSYTEQSFTLI
jgi:heterokaryon incompatibility protein (HET)